MWKITALYFGNGTIPKSVLSGGLDEEFLLKHPYIGYLLRNGKENILVDTGIHSDMIPDGKGWGGYPAEGGNHLVIKALEEEGLTVDEIHTVIYTHLHADHAGGMPLFPKAKTYFQKKEYENLLNPIPTQKVGKDYSARTIEDLKKLKNIYIVDGDFKLNNGLECYLVPGHTLGSMAIVVPTEKGKYVITGDIPHLRCCLFPQTTEMQEMDGSYRKITPAQEEMTYLFNRLIYALFSAFESFNKLKLLAEAFLPEYYLVGHEPSIIIKKNFG